MKTNMHDNSLQAYSEEGPNLTKRQRTILDFMRAHPTPRTDREIQAAMGFAERGQVQPRITELIAVGLVEECGKTTCYLTRKTVRTVKAVELSEQTEFKLTEEI